LGALVKWSGQLKNRAKDNFRMKPTPLTREEAIIVGRRFAVGRQIPATRVLAAAEAWFDADQNHRLRDEQAFRVWGLTIIRRLPAKRAYINLVQFSTKRTRDC
jgi:hypothetical protein